MTILLPSLSNAKQRSQTAVCLSNQKQIGIAIMMYSKSHNYALPGAGYSWANIIGSKDYLNVPTVEKFVNGQANVAVTQENSAFRCPSGRADQLSVHSTTNQTNWVSLEETQRPWRSGATSNDYNKSRFPGSHDIWYGVVASKGRTGVPWTMPIWEKVTTKWPKLMYIEIPEGGAAIHDGTHHQHTHKGSNQGRISPRHNNDKFTNVLFYDGHAGTFLRTVVTAGSQLSGNSSHPVIFKSSKKKW